MNHLNCKVNALLLAICVCTLRCTLSLADSPEALKPTDGHSPTTRPLQAALDLPFNRAVTLQALDDSDLTADQLSEVRKAVEAEANRLKDEYEQLTPEKIHGVEGATSMLPLEKVLEAKISDRKILREVVLRAIAEQRVKASTISLGQPTAAMRKLVARAKLENDQSRKIDEILDALDAVVAKEIKETHADQLKISVAADREKSAEIQSSMGKITGDAWLKVENLLTKEQRRAIFAPISAG